MTIGTAIVISIGMLCTTFLSACALSYHMNKEKTKQAQEVLKDFTNTLKK